MLTETVILEFERIASLVARILAIVMFFLLMVTKLPQIWQAGRKRSHVAVFNLFVGHAIASGFTSAALFAIAQVLLLAIHWMAYLFRVWSPPAEKVR